MLAFIARLRIFTLVRWWRLMVPARLRGIGVEIGDDIQVYGWPIVQMAQDSNISIGARVVLCSDSRFTALGVAKPVILRAMKAHARIKIGDDTGMSGTVICAASSVEIGRSCLIGADVTIADTDFHPIKPEGRRYKQGWDDVGIAAVAIGDNVFIGAGTRVLKGVRIGSNCVIGAGSVVVADIPSNVIAAGVPCRVLGPLEFGMDAPGAAVVSRG